MTEQDRIYSLPEGGEKRTKIKYPQTPNVEVDADLDFIYIMRKDADFAVFPIAAKLASDYSLDVSNTKKLLVEEYDNFFHQLTHSLSWGFSHKGNFELHLYDADDLDSQVKAKAGNSTVVSLDPLIYQEVHNFEVSRGYYLGGMQDFAQVNRPGSSQMSLQAEELAQVIKTPVCVVEDDIFSGGSVIAVLEKLLEAGFEIEKVIPGIQVGQPTKLEEMGIGVDPVIKYETTDGTNIFDKVDLGDPRDFLLGTSGLVIKLPNGKFGRAPYLLPFVSTTARTGIPQKLEKEFSVAVLQANIYFFQRVEEQGNYPVLLKHMDPYFVKLMCEFYGFEHNASMTQITSWAINSLDSVWETNRKIGILHEGLEDLSLPQDLIFLDVNGTLISEDSEDEYINPSVLEEFKHVVVKAEKQGFSIGLCSDSPLPQLIQFCNKVGINGPIIAENGNIIFHNGKKLVINKLPESDLLKGKIISIAESNGHEQVEDCIAPEFGGESPDYSEQKWAFGANRETSVSIFGPKSLIQQLGKNLSLQDRISVDCSPEYNYFAIHPGHYEQNKGKTLSMLNQFGHNVITVGNSMSDWIEPSSGVKCAFVADSRITEEISKKAYVSDYSVTSGVVDILNNIIGE